MKQSIKLKISNEFFHHHSEGILKHYNYIKNLFDTALQKNINIDLSIRTKKKIQTSGITAGSLNKEIRELLKSINDIEFEVNQLDGVYFVSGQTNGFDFGLIDTEYNLINFRNLCFGKRHLHDGMKEWKIFLNKPCNVQYKIAAQNLNLIQSNNIGIDLPAQKKSPIILGEIQFGNWALAYRDFFKVLKANVLTNVDVLIYIVPDGKLQSLLSDGIVTFDGTKEIINEFAKVITVPIWLIGLDID
jgi:hypothetical protein